MGSQGMRAGNCQQDIFEVNMNILIVCLIVFCQCYKTKIKISPGYHVQLPVDADFHRFNGDMGETAVKFRIYIHQHVYAPFRRQTDAQAAGLIIGKVIQLIIGLFLQAQDLSGIIYVNLPGFCQAEIIFARWKSCWPSSFSSFKSC